MTTYRITAPLDDYSGHGPGGLSFVDGSATSDDPAIVGYCQGAGYDVEPLDDTAAEPDPDTAKHAPPAKPAGRSPSKKGDA
jgi:hypothetical protein